MLLPLLDDFIALTPLDVPRDCQDERRGDLLRTDSEQAPFLFQDVLLRVRHRHDNLINPPGLLESLVSELVQSIKANGNAWRGRPQKLTHARLVPQM